MLRPIERAQRLRAAASVQSVHIQRDGLDSIVQTSESGGGQTFSCQLILAASLRKNVTDAVLEPLQLDPVYPWMERHSPYPS